MYETPIHFAKSYSQNILYMHYAACYHFYGEGTEVIRATENSLPAQIGTLSWFYAVNAVNLMWIKANSFVTLFSEAVLHM